MFTSNSLNLSEITIMEKYLSSNKRFFFTEKKHSKRVSNMKLKTKKICPKSYLLLDGNAGREIEGLKGLDDKLVTNTMHCSVGEFERRRAVRIPGNKRKKNEIK